MTPHEKIKSFISNFEFFLDESKKKLDPSKAGHNFDESFEKFDLDPDTLLLVKKLLKLHEKISGVYQEIASFDHSPLNGENPEEKPEEILPKEDRRAIMEHGLKNKILPLNAYLNFFTEDMCVQFLKTLHKESDFLSTVDQGLAEFKETLDSIFIDSINEGNREASNFSFNDATKKYIFKWWKQRDPNGKIPIKIEGRCEYWWTVKDRVMLDIIENILDNSMHELKQQKNNPEMRISLFEDRYEFINNGGNIPREELERIFKSKFTTKSFGTGIGLLHSRKIIAELGGQISLDNFEGGVRTLITFPDQAPSIPPITLKSAEE